MVAPGNVRIIRSLRTFAVVLVIGHRHSVRLPLRDEGGRWGGYSRGVAPQRAHRSCSKAVRVRSGRALAQCVHKLVLFHIGTTRGGGIKYLNFVVSKTVVAC